jgi:hypothetical protein
LTQTNERRQRSIPFGCIEDYPACYKGNLVLRRDFRGYVRFHINGGSARSNMQPTLLVGLGNRGIGAKYLAGSWSAERRRPVQD